MPKKLGRSATDPSDTAIPASLPKILTDSLPLPKLIVFDLDYTLWPFWIDTHVTPPLKPQQTHASATDRFGDPYAFYRDVPSILALLRASGTRLAVASRTHTPDLARDLLKILHVTPASASAVAAARARANDDDDEKDGGGEDGEERAGGKKKEKAEKPKKAVEFFDGGLEMYPTSKIRHFEAIQRRTGVPFEEMLFFDDESRNRDTEGLGVTMYLVRDGTSWPVIEKGIREWRKRRGVGGA